MTSDTRHDDADTPMQEYLERAMTRGAQIRRRRSLWQMTMVAVIACLVIIPLSVLGRSAPPAGQAANSSAYRFVSWRHVAYPGLNVAKAHYPVQMGCGPGFPGNFPVDVEQVTYVRPPHSAQTLALVLVHCGSGTPTPSSFYTFAPGRSPAHPRIVQVLLAPPNPRLGVLWYASHFHAGGSTVSLSAKGVTPSGTICCPDVSTTMRWTFNGHRYVHQHEAIHQVAKG